MRPPAARAAADRDRSRSHSAMISGSATCRLAFIGNSVRGRFSVAFQSGIEEGIGTSGGRGFGRGGGSLALGRAGELPKGNSPVDDLPSGDEPARSRRRRTRRRCRPGCRRSPPATACRRRVRESTPGCRWQTALRCRSCRPARRPAPRAPASRRSVAPLLRPRGPGHVVARAAEPHLTGRVEEQRLVLRHRQPGVHPAGRARHANAARCRREPAVDVLLPGSVVATPGLAK